MNSPFSFSELALRFTLHDSYCSLCLIRCEAVQAEKYLRCRAGPMKCKIKLDCIVLFVWQYRTPKITASFRKWSEAVIQDTVVYHKSIFPLKYDNERWLQQKTPPSAEILPFPKRLIRATFRELQRKFKTAVLTKLLIVPLDRTARKEPGNTRLSTSRQLWEKKLVRKISAKIEFLFLEINWSHLNFLELAARIP